MQQIRSAQDVQQLGTILGVWAHPDDESYLAAGLMAAAVQNGQKVACVTATRGEKGTQDESRWPAKDLAKIRTRELRTALNVLGIDSHYWLDYPDGYCCNVNNNDAVQKLAKIIQEQQPATILTFGPEGMTGHPDHQCMPRWVAQAVQQLSSPAQIYAAVQYEPLYESHLKEADARFNMFFNIDKPPLVQEPECAIFFCVPQELQRVKRQALQCMPSQTEAVLKAYPMEWIMEAFRVECFTVLES